ncbi:hypothetical protein [Vibrio alginolyticus]|uniref:hypothetical protein n=1 Tax=Vibrio alginolyticus TaxID=663 RepID=UPI00215C9F4F|nr:hypothetical protein [Vibrio alginolyticus]MCR9488433.1 hypothetical protein [Vibrio alginolyticus]
MLDNVDSFSKKLIWVSAICGGVIYPLSILYDLTLLTIPALLIAFLLPFFIILDLKQSRLEKGLLIVIFGACFHYFFWGGFPSINGVPIIKVPKELLMQHKVIGDIVVFACAGAGGGLIANHADAATVDKQRENSQTPKYLPRASEQVCTFDKRLVRIENKLALLKNVIILSQSIVIVVLVGVIAWFVI